MILTLASALTLAACGAPEEGPPEVRSAELRGAVLVVLDTVRADRLSCYGHVRATSPHLDELARLGVRFDQAISQAPWTLPSFAALLAAEYPQRVLRQRLRRSAVGDFGRQGTATAAITEGAFVSRAFGLDLGFREWVEEQGAVRLREPGQRSGPAGGGGIAKTFARAAEWLRHHRDERFFLLVHTYEPHAPYDRHHFTAGLEPGGVGPVFRIELLDQLRRRQLVLSGEERRYVAALYDGGLLESDRYVGGLLDTLRELGLRESTLVVVTSDHGEELGEHHPAFLGDHGHALFDTLLRVPLILHDPRREFPVREVPTQVRLIDVVPTIAELLGVELSGPVDGRSLVPVLEGREPEDRIAVSGLTEWGPQRASVRALGHKYIVRVGSGEGRIPLVPEPPQTQLYDLSADPLEQHNLAGRRPELVAALRRLLDEQRLDPARRSTRDLSAIDPEVVERLRSLGYIP